MKSPELAALDPLIPQVRILQHRFCNHQVSRLCGLSRQALSLLKLRWGHRSSRSANRVTYSSWCDRDVLQSGTSARAPYSRSNSTKSFVRSQARFQFRPFILLEVRRLRRHPHRNSTSALVPYLLRHRNIGNQDRQIGDRIVPQFAVRGGHCDLSMLRYTQTPK